MLNLGRRCSDRKGSRVICRGLKSHLWPHPVSISSGLRWVGWQDFLPSKFLGEADAGGERAEEQGEGGRKKIDVVRTHVPRVTWKHESSA